MKAILVLLLIVLSVWRSRADAEVEILDVHGEGFYLPVGKEVWEPLKKQTSANACQIKTDDESYVDLRLETHWLVRLSSNSVLHVDKVADSKAESETFAAGIDVNSVADLDIENNLINNATTGVAATDYGTLRLFNNRNTAGAVVIPDTQ